MSQNAIVVNADGPDTRVALIENGILSELYVERDRERGTVGNVYKGRVLRVLPGMQAAFVDIGEEKAAFLYAGDIAPKDGSGEETKVREGAGMPRRTGKPNDIATLVRPGQEILVQVVKDPISNKGARITSYVSLPGRNVVFMPRVGGTNRKNSLAAGGGWPSETAAITPKRGGQAEQRTPDRRQPILSVITDGRRRWVKMKTKAAASLPRP